MHAAPPKLLSTVLGVPLQLRELRDLIDDSEEPEVTRVSTTNVLAQDLSLEDPEIVGRLTPMDLLNINKRKSCAITSEEQGRAAKKNLAKSSSSANPKPSRNPALSSRHAARPTSKGDVSISATDSSGQDAPHPKRKPGIDRPKIVVAGFSDIDEILKLVKDHNLKFFSHDVFENRAREICYTLSFDDRMQADRVTDLINNRSNGRAKEYVPSMLTSTTAMLTPVKAGPTPLVKVGARGSDMMQRYKDAVNEEAGEASASVSSGRHLQGPSRRYTPLVSGRPTPTASRKIEFGMNQDSDAVASREPSVELKPAFGPHLATDTFDIKSLSLIHI